jgi:hypothetical protein
LNLRPLNRRPFSFQSPVYSFKLFAVGYLDGNTFAEKLERAIARSDRAKLIEGHAMDE